MSSFVTMRSHFLKLSFICFTMMKRCRLILTLLSILVATSKALSSSPFGKTTKNVATQVLQGTGPTQVDLNQYNLPSLQDIEREWTAVVVQKTIDSAGGVYLGVNSAKELFVDTVRVEFPRKPNSGLGIELGELAGGRSDSLGITLVKGLVEGGAAEGADIMAGDSLTSVSIVRQKRGNADGGLAEEEQEFTAKTECLCYDATVDAIRSLPPPPPSTDNNDVDEFFALTLKRIRRKPKITVKLQYPPSQNEPDTSIEMFAGENLRQGMLVRGIKLNDPLAKRFDTKSGGNCGAGGLCRTCSVSVSSGRDLLNPQRPAEQQMLADAPAWRLACKAIVGYGMREGQMTVRVNPRQWD